VAIGIQFPLVSGILLPPYFNYYHVDSFYICLIIRLIHNSFIKSYIFITICFIIKEIENIAYNFVYFN
jgi:hypothetical protein